MIVQLCVCVAFLASVASKGWQWLASSMCVALPSLGTRRREQETSNNNLCSKSTWDELISKQLLHAEHKYDDMDWENEAVDRGVVRRLPNA